MTDTKHCKGCDTTKPISEFYAREAGKPGYRYRCKMCDIARRKQGRTTANELLREIVFHYYDRSAPLSAAAEAVIYTTEPPPPALVVAYKKRQKRAEAARRRRLRSLTFQNERFAKGLIPGLYPPGVI